MPVTSWENPDFRRDTGMSRYVELSKKAEWTLDDIPFGDVPPIPEKTGGSPLAKAKRRDMWRGVVFRQLHADMRAVEMASHLFSLAEHQDAMSYYSRMVQEESRHTEAWIRLADEAGGDMEVNPHLERLSNRVVSSDLPTAAMMMQGVFEAGIIPKFRKIAKAAGGTVLAAMCDRLAIDDGIHHGSGKAYLRTLLEDLSPARRLEIAQSVADALPDFIAFATWHPKSIGPASNMMSDMDMRWAIDEASRGANMGIKIGLPFHKVDLNLPPGVDLDLKPPQLREAA